MAHQNPSGCLSAIFKLFGSSTRPVDAPAEYPYRRRDYLLSKGERSFFDALQEAASDRYLVFAKVRLADVVIIPKGTASWQSHFNRVQSKHVDFLLCDRAAVRPVLAIELDDASHERRDRQSRDDFVNAALRAAGLPLLRVRARSAYDLGNVRRQIEDALVARSS